MHRYIISMVTLVALIASTGLCLAGDDKISSKQKKKLTSLLKSIEKKGKETKPRKHEIAVPVATAGVRGAQAKKDSQFAVVWPGLEISPLFALAKNLKYDAENAATAKALKEQVDEFLRTFPEFANDPLLKDTLKILQ
jgi:hypothetical protein